MNNDGDDVADDVADEDQFAIVIRNTIVLDSSASATRVVVPGKSVAFGATRPDGTEYWVVLGANVLQDGLNRITRETNAMTYTTYGNVRGGCGHRHRTREAAQACLERDQRACRRIGGGAYSDRSVAVVIADRLYHDPEGTQPVWPAHGRSAGMVRFTRSSRKEHPLAVVAT